MVEKTFTGDDELQDIIIVGGGMAGLGCAKTLADKGKKFKLIAERIGGRIRQSPDGEVNYGAYYVTKDCENTLPFMTWKDPMDFGEYHFHRDNRHYHFSIWHGFKYSFQILKLAWDLIIFRRHMMISRKRGTTESRAAITENDPVLSKYYHQTAGEYIKQRGIEPLVKEYLEQVLWGSFFVDPHTVPAYIFMQCMLPMIVKSYAFKIDFDKITAKFKDSIIKDSVVKVEQGEVFTLTTKLGQTYRCKTLILATPMWVTNTLVEPQKVKGTMDASFYHIRGTIRPEYAVKGFNFFSIGTNAATSREKDGSYLYFYTGEDHIDKYFSEYEIIVKDTWHPALQLLGDQYINKNPKKNLFITNDHDFPSIEDAFIDGIYTANLVLKN